MDSGWTQLMSQENLIYAIWYLAKDHPDAKKLTLKVLKHALNKYGEYDYFELGVVHSEDLDEVRKYRMMSFRYAGGMPELEQVSAVMIYWQVKYYR